MKKKTKKSSKKRKVILIMIDEMAEVTDKQWKFLENHLNLTSDKMKK